MLNNDKRVSPRLFLHIFSLALSLFHFTEYSYNSFWYYFLRYHYAYNIIPLFCPTHKHHCIWHCEVSASYYLLLPSCRSPLRSSDCSRGRVWSVRCAHLCFSPRHQHTHQTIESLYHHEPSVQHGALPHRPGNPHHHPRSHRHFPLLQGVSHHHPLLPPALPRRLLRQYDFPSYTARFLDADRSHSRQSR